MVAAEHTVVGKIFSGTEIKYIYCCVFVNMLCSSDTQHGQRKQYLGDKHLKDELHEDMAFLSDLFILYLNQERKF